MNPWIIALLVVMGIVALIVIIRIIATVIMAKTVTKTMKDFFDDF